MKNGNLQFETIYHQSSQAFSFPFFSGRFLVNFATGHSNLQGTGRTCTAANKTYANTHGSCKQIVIRDATHQNCHDMPKSDQAKVQRSCFQQNPLWITELRYLMMSPNEPSLTNTFITYPELFYHLPCIFVPLCDHKMSSIYQARDVNISQLQGADSSVACSSGF